MIQVGTMTRRMRFNGIAIVVLAAAAACTDGDTSPANAGASDPAAAVNVSATPQPGGAEGAGLDTLTVTVYKSPTCGCCNAWVDHLRASGFRVATIDTDDLTSIKQRHGVEPAHAACHTALVGGYVIEGHVPAADVRRLLTERPAVTGLAVPGMPMGSPGMEGPRPERYDVLAFTRDKGATVFASH